MYTVFRLTKYADGCPSGWNKSFEKNFVDVSSAEKYAQRQLQLITQFEGFQLEEIQHETCTAFFSHECGTQLKLCLREL